MTQDPPDIVIDEQDDWIVVNGVHRFARDRWCLGDLCASLPHRGRIVEVGSLIGVSTEIFADYFDEVISIDPYAPGYDPADSNSEPARLRAAQQAFSVRLRSRSNVTQQRLSSREAADLFKDGSLDFVYIDGDHRYRAVVEDITLWTRKIRIEGALGGHDYGTPRHAGVTTAIRDTLGEPDAVFAGGHWIVRSPTERLCSRGRGVSP